MIMVLWAAMAWVAGLQLKQLGILVLVVVVLGVVAFSFFLQPYQRVRITTSSFRLTMPVMAPRTMCCRPWPRSVRAAGWAKAMDTARRPNCAS